MAKRKTKRKGSVWDFCGGKRSYLFLGPFFLSLGAGMLAGEAGAGAIVGIGLGFLARFFLGKR